jgi:2-polyprenyl-3-methyl-5-hydroxy-6-metoxy-1,4-benzoquinol methylase
MKRETKEKQYGLVFDTAEKHGISKFGSMINESWNEDPKRTLFTLSRYKFVAKMLAGYERVLEVGCADAFATCIVQQAVGHITAVDFDPVFIEDAQQRSNPHWPMSLAVHDMLAGPVKGEFDAVYNIGVLEHVGPYEERIFIENMIAQIRNTGEAAIGMSSLES